MVHENYFCICQFHWFRFSIEPACRSSRVECINFQFLRCLFRRSFALYFKTLVSLSSLIPKRPQDMKNFLRFSTRKNSECFQLSLISLQRHIVDASHKYVEGKHKLKNSSVMNFYVLPLTTACRGACSVKLHSHVMQNDFNSFRFSILAPTLFRVQWKKLEWKDNWLRMLEWLYWEIELNFVAANFEIQKFDEFQSWNLANWRTISSTAN